MEVLSVGRSVRLSVFHRFSNFSKRGFESTDSNLSDTTKFILLDSLLQEVTARVVGDFQLMFVPFDIH